jgi:hypothetical protein
MSGWFGGQVIAVAEWGRTDALGTTRRLPVFYEASDWAAGVLCVAELVQGRGTRCSAAEASNFLALIDVMVRPASSACTCVLVLLVFIGQVLLLHLVHVVPSMPVRQ